MGFNSAFKGLKDKNRIRQTHRLLCGGYMFRPFVGSSSGLLWNQVSEYCVPNKGSKHVASAQ